MRQLAPLFGCSPATVCRVIQRLRPYARSAGCGICVEMHDVRTRSCPDGTGLLLPHRRERGQAELPAWKEEHNASHRKVRTWVEHVLARMKAWEILRDCRLTGDGVHAAMLGIARLHNLALSG
ncbi:hypothetical protein GCM10027072_46100 [Streptomyces bullii]